MAELGTDLSIRLRVIADDLRAGFAQAESAATQWAKNTVAQASTVQASAGKLGGAFAAMAEAFAAEKIVHGLADMVGAAAKAATAMDTTAQIARNLGHAFDENKAEAFLDQLATSAAGSIAPIESLRAGMQRLSMVTSTQEQMERALAIATNLAAARHIDVGTAVNIVTRVLTGHVALLGRYGIATKDAAGHTLTASQMMERLATATAGAAEKLNPYERAQGELRNSMALLSETIGKMLLPVFTALVDKVVVVVNWFRGLSPEALKVVGALAGVVTAFTGVLAAATAIVAIGPAVVTAWEAIMGPTGAVIAAITAVVVIIGVLIVHWDKVRSATGTAWQYIQAVIGAASSYIHQIFAGLADLLGLHTRTWGTFRSDVGGIVGSLVGWIETQFNRFDPMFAAVHALWDQLVSKVHGAASAIVSIIESMMSAIGGAFTRVGAFFHGLYEKLPENMRKGIGEMASGLHGLANLGESVGAKLGHGIQAGLEGVANFVGGVFKHHLVTTDAPKIPDVRFPDAPGSGAGGRGGAGRAGGTHGPRERRGRQQHATRGHAAHDVFDVGPTVVYPGKLESVADPSRVNLLPDQTKSIHDADVAKTVARADRSDKAQEKLNTATATYNASIEKLTKSTNTLAELNVKAGDKINENAKNFGDMLGQLIRKIPGLSEKKDPTTGAFAGASFNPFAVFLDAIQNTKAFGDIMKTVGDIMKVIAQIFDAFRPIIDLLLRVVRMVVNGFIDLWNFVARILRLFGIHVPLLQKLTNDLNGVANQNTNQNTPLIQITHDLPTLNELATGKMKPLSPQPHNYSSLAAVQQPTIDALKDPGLGGGILGVLGEILAGIISLKFIMGLFGGGHGGGLLGGIEGLFKGGLSKLFGGGASGLMYTLGSALLGVGAGALIGGSLFGNRGDSKVGGEIGGGLGGALGGTLLAGANLGMFAGPVGAIAGALIGSLIGSLFGHKDDKAAMPDKYNTPQWGQENADLWGANVGANAGKMMNANGQQFSENPQIAAALGGKGMLEALGTYIRDMGGKGLTAAQIKEFGGETDPKNLIKGGSGGFLDLTNGVHILYSQLYKDAQDAITAIGQGFNNMANGVVGNLFGGTVRVVQALQSLNDLAGGIAAGVGTAATSGAPPNGLAAAAGAGPQITPGAGGPAAAPSVTVVQHNDFNGAHLHGIDDIRAVGAALADSANRAARMNAYSLERSSWTS